MVSQERFDLFNEVEKKYLDQELLDFGKKVKYTDDAQSKRSLKRTYIVQTSGLPDDFVLVK